MKVYTQIADHACGAACVRSIMDHFGRKVLSEKTLAKKLRAKFETGIEPHWIVDYLRAEGLQAEYISPEKSLLALRRRMDQEWIPLVVWADWGGHYCIILDMHLPGDQHWAGGWLELVDPAAAYEDRYYTNVCADRFKSMWYNPLGKEKREVIYIKDKVG